MKLWKKNQQMKLSNSHHRQYISYLYAAFKLEISHLNKLICDLISVLAISLYIGGGCTLKTLFNISHLNQLQQSTKHEKLYIDKSSILKAFIRFQTLQTIFFTTSMKYRPIFSTPFSQGSFNQMNSQIYNTDIQFNFYTSYLLLRFSLNKPQFS